MLGMASCFLSVINFSLFVIFSTFDGGAHDEAGHLA